MKNINIVASGSAGYIIKDGIITEKNGANFEVKKDGDTYSLIKGGNNNISIGRNNISVDGDISIGGNGSKMVIDGVSISIDNGVLEVKGDISKVIVNGEKFKVSKSSKKKEKGSKEFVLSNNITGITVSGSGSITVEDDKKISHNIQLIVKGSGDIIMNKYNGSNCNANVMGSGDITFENVNIKNITASVMGSGDIKGIGSFENINKTVMGSGDIELKEGKKRSFF